MKRFAFILALFVALPLWAGRSFNGTSSQIVIPGTGNAIDLVGSQMSASCWFYLTSTPSGEVDCLNKWAAAGNGGYMINYNNSNTPNQFGVYLYISIPSNHLHFLGCTPGTLLNTWHNVVFTYQNNNTMHMFLDGVHCATDTGVGSTGSIVSSGGNLNIGGQRSGVSCCYLPGIVGEDVVWNVILADAQAEALYKVCPVGYSARRAGFPPPVGYWPLWGASGSSIEPDLSGNAINGTLAGTAQANHPPCTP
jgi:hypothetical protein